MAQTKEGAMKIAAVRLGICIEEYTAYIANGLKHCRKCRIWKPTAEFCKDRSRGDGLASACLSCNRVQVRVSTKGRTSTFRGRTHTPEARAQMSTRHRGQPSPKKGIARTPQERTRISEAARKSPRLKRGREHYAYKDGQAERRHDMRRTVAYADWRKAVFERDHYTCQHCGDKRGGNLNAHHIKAYANHPELRLEISNGITLCELCHDAVHTGTPRIRRQNLVA